ncbi:Sugar diacid utilization regulator [Alteracholeplasma palmae J233]|uniref:Sugar diacid utilization regulator n=1 Tax=Alteracholeplasma palmae (strain ATCC 49389 / J233) TaxID=1318466 RepID=U4KK46_ALTPJ|nr:sugar diacid recognition domain-containing protein [Alteracholeplasma palmae]CCV63883.1 Sugar diacid utilization regulator [Alteracholeplasma palmae J233]
MKRLSKQTARQIVKELNVIIDEKINVMNEEAIIIASSDPLRVNTFHEAAKKIIDEKLEEVIVLDDNQYIGTKRGINFPIILDNKIIGVIGITGPYEAVSKYGKLIKRMVEIFMLETFLKEQKQVISSMKQYFLNEWINSDKTSNELSERGNELAINLKIKRRFVMLFLELKEKLSPYDEMMYLESIEQELFKKIYGLDAEALVLNDKPTYTILTTHTENEATLVFARTFKKEIELKYNVILSIGIGTKDLNLLPKEQKKTAKLSLQQALRHPNKMIIMYSDLSLQTLTSIISPYQQEQYINKVMKNFNDKEKTEIIHLLNAYYQHEGSLKKTAEYLNIHPNTLQYQLKNIKDKTGHDPRSLKDSSVFVILLEFYNNLFY